jgi:poly-gamma-glutamate synthesis protein (capsule biosynthesis protein)
MRGISWHDDPRCPPFAALRLLTVGYRDFAGAAQVGQLVVAEVVAHEVLAIFEGLWQLMFPIERMDPVDLFGADDEASMAANNTSAFNFRNVAGTSTLSRHAFGLAIDLNPLQNPMIVGSQVHPPAGAAYVDRGLLRPGMITPAVIDLFAQRGWLWGGDWERARDYHHFYKP